MATKKIAKKAPAVKKKTAPAKKKTPPSSNKKAAPPKKDLPPIIAGPVYQEIPLKKISGDPNQPRQHYSQPEMDELIESVREHGVLQPITVRPKGDGYMIVFGERRYRAALAVMGLFKDRDTITAAVRDLDDEATLDLQIIENLQRKDVNPMEEANAFHRLKDRSLSLEEIGNRVGKPATYVAQRLVLISLIESLQELVYADRITLKLAFKFARYSPEIQKELYKESRVPKDWAAKKDWQFTPSYGFDDKAQDLTEAAFRLDDAELYPEAGACNKCPHNSAANKLLFPDLMRKKLCHNPACFAIKCSRLYALELEKVMTDPDMLFVSLTGYPSPEDKARLKTAKELGVVILDDDNVELVREPSPVSSWEEWQEDYIDEDESDEEKAESLQQARIDYDEEVNNYNAEIEKYNNAQATGRFKKAFVITGWYGTKPGTIVNVRFKTGKGSKVEVPADATTDVKTMALNQELQGIEERNKRNQELDREKIFTASVEALKPVLTSCQDDLHPEEWAALAMLMADTTHVAGDLAKEQLRTGHDYHGLKLFQSLADNPLAVRPLIFQMIRMALYHKLVNANQADYGRFGNTAAIFSLAKLWVPDAVHQIEVDQQIKIDKRTANMEKRITALKKKLDEATTENQ